MAAAQQQMSGSLQTLAKIAVHLGNIVAVQDTSPPGAMSNSYIEFLNNKVLKNGHIFSFVKCILYIYFIFCYKTFVVKNI